MSVFVSIGIIILAMLIMAFLQLPSGVFALFHHYASGKYSANRTSDLSTFYFLGTETITTCLFLSCLYFSYIFSLSDLPDLCHFFDWTISIIMIILAIVSFFIYYRPHRKGAQTFIPRQIASALDQNARAVKSRSDAFMLGAFSGTCELILILPILILIAVESATIATTSYFVFALLFILAPLLPLFFYRILFRDHYNLADIIKLRIKNKFFTRLILSLSYLSIAFLIIFFRILA